MEPITYEAVQRNPELLQALIIKAHQERAEAGIAENLLGDHCAVEDAAERHGEACDLRDKGVPHDV